ncbi:phytoene dehydrogenase [Longimycelium tulufanense]|uniref:Phytoene dehydrogenase n=1 Tax=Longimycelium tulufanense TaxID=907463 RepID=A0A8J3FTQ1_9PSEU|nr:phytoene dehydrogenase [Longimycelium tulufanense]
MLGGGVAGLTVAHELAQRGFRVTVYERKALGGKARSIPVAGTATGGRRDLPGEHGHRGIFGFYHNLPDTLRRIPFPGNENGVHDNLAEVKRVSFARAGGREDLLLPPFPPKPDAFTPEALQRLIVAVIQQLAHLPLHEALFLARQAAIFMTSSDERRFGQWEHVSWWDFIKADGKSEDYRRLFGGGVQIIQALKPENASARTSGQGGEAIIYSYLGLGVDGPADRILNGPTSERWLDPWVAHLRSLGVRFQLNHTVDGLELEKNRVVAATARTPNGSTRIEADWFVCAMPADRAVRLWNRDILDADPRLGDMRELEHTWSNGIQFYLRRRVPVFPGHVAHVDSPWALVSINQAQFWHDDFASTWGDGVARDSLSVVISDWETPGIRYGKPANRCTPQEIADEVWAQLKAHLEDTGRQYLPDDVLHSWFLDPAIAVADTGLTNDEPYLLNTVGSWFQRPDAATAIPNLFLAADYVRTPSNVDFTSMETANEAGRRAVNALLDAADSRAERVRLFSGYQPPEFDLAKRIDAERFRLGLPHILDTPWPA